MSGRAPSAARWRMGGIALFCVATFLLISMGGAIVAAPLTVPLMFVVTRRHPTTAFRAIAAVLIAATIAEVAWALMYVVAGEVKPWIWLVPLVAALVATAALLTTSDTRKRSAVQV